jgi:hypothetical protein
MLTLDHDATVPVVFPHKRVVTEDRCIRSLCLLPKAFMSIPSALAPYLGLTLPSTLDLYSASESMKSQVRDNKILNQSP